MEYDVMFSNKWTSSFSITYFGTSNVVVWLCSILGDEEFPGIPPRICSISSVYATSSHAINQIVGKTKYKNQRQFIVLKWSSVSYTFTIPLRNTYAQHYIIHLVYFSLWLWIIYITEAKRFCDRTSVITLVSKNFGRLIKTDKSMTGSVDTTTRFVAV